MKGIAKLQLLIMLHIKELGFYSQIMMKLVQIRQFSSEINSPAKKIFAG